MDLTGNQFDDIAATVAALVTVALALSAALGNSVMLITESVKSALKPRDGWGGLIAIAVASVLCILASVLTARIATDADGTTDYLGAVAIGFFIALVVGSGAVNAHKAAGAVNIETSAAIKSERDYQTSLKLAPVEFHARKILQNAALDDAADFPTGNTLSYRTDDINETEDFDAIIAAGPQPGHTCDYTPDESAEEEKPNVTPAITHGSSFA